jgi:hypothetical protein
MRNEWKKVLSHGLGARKKNFIGYGITLILVMILNWTFYQIVVTNPTQYYRQKSPTAY